MHDFLRIQRKWIATLVFLGLFAALFIPSVSYADYNPWDFITLIDPTCFLASYRCVPVGCGCNIHGCFDLVCNAFPAAFIETPSSPFSSEISFVSELISLLTVASPLNAAGSGGAAQEGQTNLRFYEAHVFNFPTLWYMELAFPLHRICPYDGVAWELNYLSELDFISWRTGAADYLTMDYLFGALASVSHACELNSILSVGGISITDSCMGSWGLTYPRTGFVVTNSKAVASAAAAYRALRVVSNPLGRIVTLPKIFNAAGYLQMGMPGEPFRAKPLNCIPVGMSALAWDNIDIKPFPNENRGYVWVWWENRCCCLPTTMCVI